MVSELQSLCWSCAKGADECCFMESLEPVKGWKAKKVMCEGNPTYHVIRCPNFRLAQNANRKQPCALKKGIAVRCVETGEIYPSLSRCEKELHLRKGYISACIKYGIVSPTGLHFESVKDYE